MYKGGKLTRALLTAGACLFAGDAFAHHSFAMFDAGRIWKWEGTVAQYNFANPHIHLVLAVARDTPEAKAAGVDTTGVWDFEGESVAQSARQGLNRASLKVGDKVQVIGFPLKGDGKGGAGLVVIKPSGDIVYFSNNKQITPETPLKWR